MIKTTKGFSLVELIMVIIIVGILCIVAVPLYSKYIRRAAAIEGELLLSAIRSAQNIYYNKTAAFYTTNFEWVSKADFSDDEYVDASTNQYFTSFCIYSDEDGWTAETEADEDTQAAGISLTLMLPINEQAVLIKNMDETAQKKPLV